MNVLFENLLKTTLISSLGICILIILKTCIFKIFSKKFNYYIWLIILFRMLLFPVSCSIEFKTKTKESYTLIDNITNFNNNHPNKNLTLLFICIWIIGVIFYLARLLIKYVKFKNLIVDTSFEVEDENINSTYRELLSELNIKNNIPLRYTDELASPAGVGLFKPYIFLLDLPYDGENIYWILKHELTHFKHRDILIKFIVVFVKAIYWFNPFVYIMSKKIDSDCELCCDESVINECSSKQKKEYALTILRAIELNNLNKMGMLATEFTKTNLEIRIKSIGKRRGKRGIILAILIFIGSCFSFIDVNAQAPLKKKSLSENKTVVPSTGFSFETTDYTYATAPEHVRKLYEEKCKKIGEVPRDTDKIEIYNTDNTIE
ncbi:M56 family metallopeptidase [Clostridioides difficile]|uniref:Beta-lactamase inducer n=1 Tax=Clostridioides difficile TaxID=1496 RepID=A0A386JBY0_CLODI|nr:M56 family metallopeptidase [Clostridioides difficile]AYD68684.1 beta-lactamase inducer [Clostridioides difficile]HBG7285451.1 M56 family metallopeptidase [Clostridioides difficile]